MRTDGHDFLSRLTNFPLNTFAGKFLANSIRLGLGTALGADELSMLHRAAFLAALCNIAINGRGGCGGAIKPSREITRIGLEQSFSAARDQFFATGGWRGLSEFHQGIIQERFLKVAVADENLA
jgi:hypothetical protein